MRSPVCRNQNNSEGDTSVKGYAIVPYIQGVTEPIKRMLSNCNIKVALKPYLTLGHISAKPKDPVKTNQKTYAIYSIPCGDCEKEYLGQSKRQFGTRLKEHQKAKRTSTFSLYCSGGCLPINPMLSYYWHYLHWHSLLRLKKTVTTNPLSRNVPQCALLNFLLL